MLSAYFTRQSRARRRVILGLMKLSAFGLLITVSIRMRDPITYLLIAAMLLLALVYGSMRVVNDLIDTPLIERAVRYRLAWLSARSRARYYDATIRALHRNGITHRTLN